MNNLIEILDYFYLIDISNKIY